MWLDELRSVFYLCISALTAIKSYRKEAAPVSTASPLEETINTTYLYLEIITNRRLFRNDSADDSLAAHAVADNDVYLRAAAAFELGYGVGYFETL